MRVLRRAGVGASGPLPSFRGSALLEEVSLDRNNLEGGVADAFDYCPSLLKVDVSHNSISAPVFRFEGSTNVVTMDISHNSMHGAIPSEWAELKSCKAVVASHNLLTAPTEGGKSVMPLLAMAELEIIDLNHNRFNFWREENVGNEGFFVQFLIYTAPATTSKLDLSYNLIKEPSFTHTKAKPWGPPILHEPSLGKYPRLSHLDLSHNFLWGTLALGSLTTNFAVSHNNITKFFPRSAASCCTAAALRRQLYSIDWRNQQTSVGLALTVEQGVVSIDHALNSSIVFKTLEFMPRHDAFEQVELPVESGRFPFSCPTWLVH
jgi:hypothetical protein